MKRSGPVGPNDLIVFTKAWNFKGDNNQTIYGEKEYWFNPAVPIRGMEPCKLQKKGEEIECVKIYYEDPIKGTYYIILVGTITEFINTCQQANIATALLFDIYAQGMTIKQFIEAIEGKLIH